MASVNLLSRYQLENLRRQQAKFLLVAITDDSNEIPEHPLLKPDFIVAATTARSVDQIESLRAFFTEVAGRQLPIWWPMVLISARGEVENEVALEIEKRGFTKVYRYAGGWMSLIASD
mgnify:CR=1 FL=1